MKKSFALLTICALLNIANMSASLTQKENPLTTQTNQFIPNSGAITQAWSCGQTAYDATNTTLFAGTSIADTTNMTLAPYDLARITVASDGSPTTTPLIPLNSTVSTNGTFGYSPLKYKAPTHLALMPGTKPDLVVTVTGCYKINLIPDALKADGSVILQSGEIMDAGNAPTRDIAAIAASKDYIFAAVGAGANGPLQFKDATIGYDPHNGGLASAHGKRGIAILRKNSSGTALEQLSVNNLDTLYSGTGDTYFLDLSASASLVAFTDHAITATGALNAGMDLWTTSTIVTAEISEHVDMVWDETLGCLYIGLSNVKRDNPTKRGGVCDILVGKLSTVNNTKKFTLSPLIQNLNKAQLYDVPAVRAQQAAESAWLVVTAAKNAATRYPFWAQGVADAVRQRALSIVRKNGADKAVNDTNIKAWTEYGDTPHTIHGAFLSGGIATAEAQAQYVIEHTPQSMLINPAINTPNTRSAAYIFPALVTAAAAMDFSPTASTETIVQAAEAVAAAYVNQVPNDPSGVNTDKLIVGFYGDGCPLENIDPRLSARNLKVMHTSTGRDYLIINGVTGLPANAVGECVISQSRNWIYALPLMGVGNTSQGMLAACSYLSNIPTFIKTPSSLGEMPRDDEPAFVVGGHNPLPGSHVSEIFVVGDSVFFCLNNIKNKEAGIFQSTALFKPCGSIIGWTPAQRVAGNVDRVFGGGLNPSTGNFLFMSSMSNDPSLTTTWINDQNPQAITNVANYYTTGNTPKTTNWGKSDTVTPHIPDATTGLMLSNNLTSTLASIFTGADKIGQIFTFDEWTPGFYANSFSMAIVTGGSKVALVQTGRWNNAKSAFDPYKTFQKPVAPGHAYNAQDNVFTFDLSQQTNVDIGTITCAEIARSTRGNSGWVFVGGSKGVAVLSCNDKTLDTFASLTPPTKPATAVDSYDYGVSAVLNKATSVANGAADAQDILEAVASLLGDPSGILQGVPVGTGGNTWEEGKNDAMNFIAAYSSAGRGWPSYSGLDYLGNGNKTADNSSLNFPYGYTNGVANWSFKQLTPAAGNSFTGVRKLVASGNYLFVGTRDKVYRIGLNDARKFDGTGTTSLGESIVFDINNLPSSTATAGIAGISDACAFSNDPSGAADFAIATIHGLFVASWDYLREKYITQEVLFNGKSLGPVVHLDFLPNTKGGPASSTVIQNGSITTEDSTIIGNLYALAANFAQDTAIIYRFFVKAGVNSFAEIRPLADKTGKTSAYVTLPGFRLNVATDGALLFDELSRNNHNLVELYTVGYPASAQKFSNPTPSSATQVGIIGREPASGTWLLPTTANLIVNE